MTYSKKTYKIETLGCRTNQYESAAYIKQLKELGFREALPEETASICIVNTCTVTEEADKSSRREIRKLAKKHPEAKLVVTGCLAERAFTEIKEISGVDLVVPNKEKEKLVSQLFSLEGFFEQKGEDFPEFVIDQFAGHTRAFVKVQDGCNSFCTYCIIPYVRGRSRSRSVDAIIKEIQGLIDHGYQEVVLTGINIGDFDGGDGKNSLADLVREVDQLPGLSRLRISSIDPDEVGEALLQAVLEGKNTCPSMHLVLQSGSNSILKKMNRKYTCHQFLQAVESLQEKAPEFTITTDVIVGFPGETEEDFAKTLEIIERVRFAKVHMFPYSPRDRTRAALYPGRLSSEEMQRRKHLLLKKSEEMAFLLRQDYVGKKMEVLVEEIVPLKRAFEGKERECFVAIGHTRNFLKVEIPLAFSNQIVSNQVVFVNLKGNLPDALWGTLCL